MSEKYIDVVFDGPPGPECGRFVEVENMQGASIKVGEWIDRGDGYWALRIPAFVCHLPAAENLAKALETMMSHIESGTLVRDITKDGQADWGINMMKFCTDLNQATAALSAWRKAMGED